MPATYDRRTCFKIDVDFRDELRDVLDAIEEAANVPFGEAFDFGTSDLKRR